MENCSLPENETFNAQNVISLLKKTWDETPDEIKKGIDPAATITGSLIMGGLQYKTVRPLKILHRCISTTSALPKEKFEKCMKWSGGLQVIKNNSKQIEDAATSTQVADAKVIQEVKHHLSKSANLTLGLGVAVSTISILTETTALYKIWQVIKEAKEFSKTVLAQERAAIQAKFDQIPGMIKKFVGSIQPEKFINMNDRQRFLLHVRKTTERDELVAFIRNLGDEIGKLEVQVGSRIEKLQSFVDASLSSGVSQAAQCVSMGANTAILGSAAHPALLVLAAVVTAAHLVLAVGRTITAVKANSTMKDLIVQVGELQEMRKVLDEQQAHVNLEFKKFNEWFLSEDDDDDMDDGWMDGE